MLIPVNSLPSNFKPYKFKSFKMKAMSLQQAVDLGKNPSLKDIVKLLQTLVGDEIDASVLVPVDVKYLVAMLAFHAYPKQKWDLELTCPHCKEKHKRAITMSDFPPVPSLAADDPYPLTIDDGKHVWELGYASVDAWEEMISKLGITKDTDLDDLDPAQYIDIVAPYILSVDGKNERTRETLLEIDDFGILNLMLEAIKTYFLDDTQAEFECPKCKKKYSVSLSAVEVTQYTPFLDKTAVSKYKTNFRL